MPRHAADDQKQQRAGGAADAVARRTPAGNGRPRLSRPAILDRALAVADGEGLEAVSIRRLARDLDVTPMALYWHFPDKQALLHALGDQLLTDLDLAVDHALPWPDQLRTLVVSLTRVLRAHPCAAVLVGSLPTTSSPRALAATEVMLDILRRAGFSAAQATYITRQIVRTTTAMMLADFASAPPGEDTHAASEQTRQLLAELSPTLFPRIVEAAAPLSEIDDPDEYYELGVELILAGVETTAARRQTGQK